MPAVGYRPSSSRAVAPCRGRWLYVWGAQTGGAQRLGAPETTITAIREKHARGIPPEDAQIVEFTRELLRKHRVDDATFTHPAPSPARAFASMRSTFTSGPRNQAAAVKVVETSTSGV